jgi:hypothetical protein
LADFSAALSIALPSARPVCPVHAIYLPTKACGGGFDLLAFALCASLFSFAIHTSVSMNNFCVLEMKRLLFKEILKISIELAGKIYKCMYLSLASGFFFICCVSCVKVSKKLPKID